MLSDDQTGPNPVPHQHSLWNSKKVPALPKIFLANLAKKRKEDILASKQTQITSKYTTMQPSVNLTPRVTILDALTELHQAHDETVAAFFKEKKQELSANISKKYFSQTSIKSIARLAELSGVKPGVAKRITRADIESKPPLEAYNQIQSILGIPQITDQTIIDQKRKHLISSLIKTLIQTTPPDYKEIITEKMTDLDFISKVDQKVCSINELDVLNNTILPHDLIDKTAIDYMNVRHYMPAFLRRIITETQNDPKIISRIQTIETLYTEVRKASRTIFPNGPKKLRRGHLIKAISIISENTSTPDDKVARNILDNHIDIFEPSRNRAIITSLLKHPDTQPIVTEILNRSSN